MGNYTNSGLVAYCETALNNYKTVYMWSGIFRKVTTAYIDQLYNQNLNYYLQNHPNATAAQKEEYMSGIGYSAERVKYLKSLDGKGYYGCDCVGLIKSYYWGGVGSPNYDDPKGSDLNVGDMYNAATIKGLYADFDYVPGRLVVQDGHIGVYVGNNYVIECTLAGTGNAIKKTPYSAVWPKWCQCPYINNNDEQQCKDIYLSIGVAAIRKAPSTSGTLVSRCVRNGYYPASQIITPTNSSQKWFQHAGKDLYSALTDTDGSKLFNLYGKYSIGITNAPVNIRVSSSISSDVIVKLDKGTTVYLTNKNINSGGYTWTQVIYDSKLAWCDSQWINK